MKRKKLAGAKLMVVIPVAAVLIASVAHATLGGLLPRLGGSLSTWVGGHSTVPVHAPHLVISGVDLLPSGTGIGVGLCAAAAEASAACDVLAGGNSRSAATLQSNQSIHVYNQTDKTVDLSGWGVADRADVLQKLPAVALPSHQELKITAQMLGGQIGNGITSAGDFLMLFDPSGHVVDALSWGSDTSIMNPSITAIPVGHSAMRLNPNLDTDRASDWSVTY